MQCTLFQYVGHNYVRLNGIHAKIILVIRKVDIIIVKRSKSVEILMHQKLLKCQWIHVMCVLCLCLLN